MSPEQWARLHQRVEWEIDCAYAAGFAAGVECARVAMNAAVTAAIDPGPDVNPGARAAVLTRSAKAVVGRLVAEMDRAAARTQPDRPATSVVLDIDDRIGAAA